LENAKNLYAERVSWRTSAAMRRDVRSDDADRPTTGPTVRRRRKNLEPFSALRSLSKHRLAQVSLPAGLADGCPVGLSLIGAPGADEMLLNLAAAISVYCG
jgi:hypothetical protein